MALTLEQQAAIDRVRGNGSALFGTAPTQRARTFAQGASFNTADEAEAAITSAITGRPQQEIEQDIRTKLYDYQQQSPIESKVMEFAGALLPSMAASAITRSPAPMTGVFSKFAPNVAKVMGIGGIEGGVQTIGGMEGTLSERLDQPEQIAFGTMMGAGTAGGLYGAGTAGLRGLEAASEALRFVSGSRARNAVNNEIQRISTEAGIDAQEAMRRLLNGELLAEDPVVAQALRGYMGTGAAETEIRSVMADRATDTGVRGSRPATTRRSAIQTIRSGIAAGLDRNIYRHMRASDDLLRQMERTQYDQAFRAVQDAPQPVVDQMYEVISRFPSGGKGLKDAFKSETGRDPFFTVDDLGRVSFRMLPTMRDAEQLRRIIADESRRLRIAGGADATIGVNLGNAESGLRSVIDDASPDLRAARENARLIRARNENYRLGTTSGARSADEVEVEFNNIVNTRNPGLIQAYRLGYLQNIQSKMQSGNKASLVKRLTDPETKEGAVFRTIYPADLQDAALSRLGVARQSQEAADKMLSGSSTMPTMRASQREGLIPENIQNAGLAADAINGNMSAAQNLLGRVIQQFRPNLSDAERVRVARVLLSNDPQIVRRALTSREGLRSLQSLIIPLADSPAMSAALAGTTLAPEMGK
jgi:hypothetical protein